MITPLFPKKKKTKIDLLIERLEADMKLASAAIRHLKKMTRKCGVANISPFDEKRWSPKCDDAWMLLAGIKIMLDIGVLPETYDEMWLRAYKPTTVNWVGKHITEPWPGAHGDQHLSDKITIKRPTLATPWDVIDAPKKKRKK